MNVLWGAAVLLSLVAVIYGQKTVITKTEYKIVKAEGITAR